MHGRMGGEVVRRQMVGVVVSSGGVVCIVYSSPYVRAETLYSTIVQYSK